MNRMARAISWQVLKIFMILSFGMMNRFILKLNESLTKWKLIHLSHGCCSQVYSLCIHICTTRWSVKHFEISPAFRFDLVQLFRATLHNFWSFKRTKKKNNLIFLSSNLWYVFHLIQNDFCSLLSIFIAIVCTVVD